MHRNGTANRRRFHAGRRRPHRRRPFSIRTSLPPSRFLVHRVSAVTLLLFVATIAPAAPPPSAKTASKHWSFQPVKRSAPPKVNNAAWAATDLDRFILAKLDAAKLQPGPDASPETLCRRL